MVDQPSQRDRGPIAVGLLLIVIGVIFLIGQWVDVNLGRYGWPFLIIVPGVVLWMFALFVGGSAGVGFGVLGAMISTVGFVLFYQDATDHWESWAYAWALVAPGSVGLALAVHGLIHGDRDILLSGMRTLVVGIALFLCFGLFFEAVVGLGDSPPTLLRDVILPGGLVVLGAGIVVAGLVSSTRPSGESRQG